MINLVKKPPHRPFLFIIGGLLTIHLVGVLFFFWQRYTSRVKHRTFKKSLNSYLPRALLDNKKADLQQQTLKEGTGPLFNRIYKTYIKKGRYNAQELIQDIKKNIDIYCPSELARFEKVKGDKNIFKTGDHYEIYISGPWNGPVLVLEHDHHSFTFATRQGHLEAGVIKFLAKDQKDRHGSHILFKIESWSRSKDSLVDLAYDKLKLAQAGQTSMWVVFCKNVVTQLEGELIGDIQISTHKIESDKIQ